MIVRLCVNYPKGSREPFQNQQSSLSQLACFTPPPTPHHTLLPPFWTVYFVVNACGSGSGVETLWLQFLTAFGVGCPTLLHRLFGRI